MSRPVGVTQATRDRCTERDGGKCFRCTRGKPSEQLHHRRPRGMGGSKRPQTNSCSNLVSLCAQCHREVESDRQQALIDGFLVPQVGDPRTFSVRHGRLGHVYLDDLGGMETL